MAIFGSFIDLLAHCSDVGKSIQWIDKDPSVIIWSKYKKGLCSGVKRCD